MSESEIKLQFKENKQVLCIDNGTYIKNKEGFGSTCILKLDDFSLYFEKQPVIEKSLCDLKNPSSAGLYEYVERW